MPVARAAPTALGAAASGGVPTLVVDAGLRWLFEGQQCIDKGGEHRKRTGP